MNAKRIAAAVTVLTIPLGAAACGSQNQNHRTAAAAAAKSASPTASPTPTVNYGQQYLTDVQPVNIANARYTAVVAACKAGTITSPKTFARSANASSATENTFGQELLRQTWPAAAQSAVHTLATDDITLSTDDYNDANAPTWCVVGDTWHSNNGQLANIDNQQWVTVRTQAQVVRADVGLPGNAIGQ